MKYKYAILPLWVVVLCCLFVACGNEGSTKHHGSDTTKTELSASVSPIEAIDVVVDTPQIDVPIAINLMHPDDDYATQFTIEEYGITEENGRSIHIEPQTGYYPNYISGKRFKTPRQVLFETSEVVEFLTLSMDIVNNTKQKLDISELNIQVDESRIDTLPLIYICTLDECGNSLQFVNSGWAKWEGFTFSYSLLKKGEEFNGTYKKQKHIPYFEGIKTVKLLPDLMEMGYDYKGLIRFLKKEAREAFGEDCDDMFPSPSDECSIITHDFYGYDIGFVKNKFKPFEAKKSPGSDYTFIGFARLYGCIQFDHSNRKIEFMSEIPLSTEGGFGADSYECDKFDIRLKSEGEAYTLRYPYTTVIEPGGTEFVKLTFIADKSSMHTFHIEAKNNNGLSIRSKDIHYHHYKPRY